MSRELYDHTEMATEVVDIAKEENFSAALAYYERIAPALIKWNVDYRTRWSFRTAAASLLVAAFVLGLLVGSEIT